jgi:hypothetical protein
MNELSKLDSIVDIRKYYRDFYFNKINQLSTYNYFFIAFHRKVFREICKRYKLKGSEFLVLIAALRLLSTHSLPYFTSKLIYSSKLVPYCSTHVIRLVGILYKRGFFIRIGFGKYLISKDGQRILKEVTELFNGYLDGYLTRESKHVQEFKQKIRKDKQKAKRSKPKRKYIRKK